MNTIKGGKADRLSIDKIASKFNISLDDIKKELEMGINVEREHTNDKFLAKEIAMDHLTEMPDYYTRLAKMEKNAMRTWGREDIKEALRNRLSLINENRNS